MKPAAAAAVMILVIAACGPRVPNLTPRIFEDRAAAMRSAPIIVVVRIKDAKILSPAREVDKPSNTPGPQMPTIPLQLAEIKAQLLFTVKGPQLPKDLAFYSWIWNSGKHGGARLFSPFPDTVTAIFLREEDGVLHTVGDYPSYDLRLAGSWIPAIESLWNTPELANTPSIERLVRLRIRAQLEALSPSQLREDFDEHGQRPNHSWMLDLDELVLLTKPQIVAAQLDDLCKNSRAEATRFAACYLTAEYFPGRCDAFQIADKSLQGTLASGYLNRKHKGCVASYRDSHADRFIGGVSADNLRMFAQGMDADAKSTACRLAAENAIQIPECRAH